MINLKGGIVGATPPGCSVDGGGGGELALVVSLSVVFLVENFFVDVVPPLVLLHTVGVRVHLRLHHHGGGYHLAIDITLVMVQRNLPAFFNSLKFHL